MNVALIKHGLIRGFTCFSCYQKHSLDVIFINFLNNLERHFRELFDFYDNRSTWQLEELIITCNNYVDKRKYFTKK